MLDLSLGEGPDLQEHLREVPDVFLVLRCEEDCAFAALIDRCLDPCLVRAGLRKVLLSGDPVVFPGEVPGAG